MTGIGQEMVMMIEMTGKEAAGGDIVVPLRLIGTGDETEGGIMTMTGGEEAETETGVTHAHQKGLIVAKEARPVLMILDDITNAAAHHLTKSGRSVDESMIKTIRLLTSSSSSSYCQQLQIQPSRLDHSSGHTISLLPHLPLVSMDYHE